MSKSAEDRGVKTSQKSTNRSNASCETYTKTIIKDKSLLIGEAIDDAHEEHEARQDILKSEVCSSPDATVKFGEEKVDICYSTHKKATAAHHEAITASLEEANKRDSSKTSAKAKSADKQQLEIKLNGDGFKIPHGRAKRHKKKIEIS